MKGEIVEHFDVDELDGASPIEDWEDMGLSASILHDPKNREPGPMRHAVSIGSEVIILEYDES